MKTRSEPRHCGNCPKQIDPRNKTGYCVNCHQKFRPPGHGDRVSAGIRRKLAIDPAALQAKRAAARAIEEKMSPEARKARNRRFSENRVWERGFAAAMTPEVRAKAAASLSETRMAWCPRELRGEYRHLRRTKHIPKAEARAMIEQQHEAEMARWRRTLGTTARPPHIAGPVGEKAVELVCRATQLRPEDLRGDRRFRKIVRARWVVYVAMRAAGRSLPTIARFMGRSDHDSVSHGLIQSKICAQQDPEFAKLLADVMEACGLNGTTEEEREAA